MPLILPRDLPAAAALNRENIFTMTHARASTQDIRPLRILIVNLMPAKVRTEIQLARVLSNTSLQVQLTLLHMGSHRSRNTTAEHMARFYTGFDDISDHYYDGMILTGAPVETLPFEEVDYWDELCRVMDFAQTHVYSSMHICWGAQAALYHFYGIDKHLLPAKLSGVFPTRVVRPRNPLMRGFDEVFDAPQSRHTTVLADEVAAHPGIRVLARSDEAGLHILATENGRRIFIMGHPEYDRETLCDEYLRDLALDPATPVPAHYFAGDDPSADILFRWRAHASLLFSNWLNYYVYQETPYDITEMGTLAH